MSYTGVISDRQASGRWLAVRDLSGYRTTGRIPAETRTALPRNCARSFGGPRGAGVAVGGGMLNILPVILSSALPVVGGTTVKPGVWPDAVAVLSDTAACTGTLIAPDVVLTAGHCIDTKPAVVLVDSVDYGQPGGEAIRVKWSLAYPDWQRAYDVGVVVLDHPAKAQPRLVAAACSAREGLVPDAEVELVGFGLTTKSGTGDNTRLHQAALSVIDATCTDDPACAAAIAPGGEFTAGGHGSDACFGDSGGPVYLHTSMGPALLGVVSRASAVSGPPCGDGGIYVRADKVISWVQQVTQEKIARTHCAGAGDDGGSDASTDGSAGGTAGCAAGGGTGGIMTIALGVIAAAWAYRRRGRHQSVPSKAPCRRRAILAR
jgi:secreted trypsin-like serine protease